MTQSSSNTYVVDQPYSIVIYDKGHNFTGQVVLTSLDEWPTQFKISAQPNAIDESDEWETRWRYLLKGEFAGELIDSNTCNKCYLLVQPVSPDLVSRIRVDIDIDDDDDDDDNSPGSKPPITTSLPNLPILIAIAIVGIIFVGLLIYLFLFSK